MKPEIPTNTYRPEDYEWPADAYNQDGKRTGKQWRPAQRMEYIKYLFSRGIIDPHKGDLAKKFGVDPKTLWLDFHKVYDLGIEPGELKIAKVKMASALSNAVVEASTLVVKSVGKDKAAAIGALVNVTGAYTEFLEKFDIKRPGLIDVQKPIVIRWEDRREGGKA